MFALESDGPADAAREAHLAESEDALDALAWPLGNLALEMTRCGWMHGRGRDVPAGVGQPGGAPRAAATADLRGWGRRPGARPAGRGPQLHLGPPGVGPAAV